MSVKPRIKLDKKEAKKGDIVEVKALVAHIMETGQRKDAQGNTVSAKPEFEDVKIIAARLGMPARRVLEIINAQVTQKA